MLAYTEACQSDLYSAVWLHIFGTDKSHTSPKNTASLLDHMETAPDTDSYQFAQAHYEISLAEMVSQAF